MKTRLARQLETGAAWIAVVVASAAAVLGLVGPLLGGAGPGLRGPIGFAAETVAAMWIPGGLLAGIVAVVALARRLRAPAAALAAVALVVLGPDLWARFLAPGARPAADRPVLRVAAVNLAEQNLDDPAMPASVRELDADVLVLVEFTPRWARQLEPRFGADYPHRWLAAAPESPGVYDDGLRVAVWSRLPAAGDPEVRILRGANGQIRVPLLFHGRPFALYAIHPWKPYPLSLYESSWRERQELLDWIRGERLPAIVAGDFNATPRSAFVRGLRQCGLTNASEELHGSAPVTWPTYPTWLAPLRIAIDHVMHGAAFTAIAFRRAPPTRSDHNAVVAELVWSDE